MRPSQSDFVCHRSAEGGKNVANPVSTGSLSDSERCKDSICYRVLKFTPQLNQRWFETPSVRDLVPHDITQPREVVAAPVASINECIRQSRAGGYGGSDMGNHVGPTICALCKRAFGV
jgi:hypothetical protein